MQTGDLARSKMGLQLTIQKVLEEMVVAIPLLPLIQGHAEQAVARQALHKGAAVEGFPVLVGLCLADRLAQRGTEAVEDRRFAQVVTHRG